MSGCKGPCRAAAAVVFALVLQGMPGLLVPEEASAAELPRLALLPVEGLEGVPEQASGRLTTALLNELKTRDGELQVVPPRSGQPVASNPATAREVEQALALGRRRLAALQFASAVAAFERGIALALADPAYANFDEVREAYVSVAEARFRLGQRKGARSALAEVVRLDPGFQLPSSRYPPVFVSALEQARAQGAGQPRGELSVEGPADWNAFLDGHPLGRLPASATDLRSGRHYLRGEGPHGELLGQVVELSGGSVRVYFAPGEERALPQGSSVVDVEGVSRLDAWCRARGADFALVVVMFRVGADVSVGAGLYSTRARGFVAFPPLHLDASLATANVEAFKLVDRISAALVSFGAPAVLPLDLTGRTAAVEAKPPAAAVAEASRPEPSVPPRLTPPEKVTPPPAGGLEPLPVSAPGGVQEGRVGWPWWVWAAGGAALAAAGGGTAYGLVQAHRRATGTVTATW